MGFRRQVAQEGVLPSLQNESRGENRRISRSSGGDVR